MPYQHIFFDLDHTLWDFERNSQEALAEMFDQFKLAQLSEQVIWEDFIKIFYEVNYELWTLYDHNQIDQLTLRNTRFQKVLEKLGAPSDKIPNEVLAKTYTDLTPKKSHLIPFAKEILDYLQDKYILHIISNGFADVQAIKLQHSGIQDYFDVVVTPESFGFKKPRREIFDLTIDQIQAERSQCIMIGDSLTTDMKGAKNAELDHVFFNPHRKAHQENLQHEIDSLERLTDLL